MTISAEMKFSDAAHSWLEMRDAGTSRARYLKPRIERTITAARTTRESSTASARLANLPTGRRRRASLRPAFSHPITFGRPLFLNTYSRERDAK